MLDRDLAELYQVTTAALNQALRRNRERFPSDFMFQLTQSEVTQLNRSQIVIGAQKHRDPRFRPYAFTEQGIAMLSSVLRSKRAISVNIEIMRAFVKLRQMLASNSELSRRLNRGSSPTVREGAAVQGCVRRDSSIDVATCSDSQTNRISFATGEEVGSAAKLSDIENVEIVFKDASDTTQTN